MHMLVEDGVRKLWASSGCTQEKRLESNKKDETKGDKTALLEEQMAIRPFRLQETRNGGRMIEVSYLGAHGVLQRFERARK